MQTASLPILKMFWPIFFMLLFAVSCIEESKTEMCYDAALEASHSGICTEDCPQVCGCDHQTYCNACKAESVGIRVDYSGPCQ
jgi:hypothetical protein